MGVSDSQNTLAGQIEGRPLNMFIDLRHRSVQAIAQQIENFATPGSAVASRLGTNGTIDSAPEQDAIEFYMWEHAIGVIRQRVNRYAPLGEYRDLLEQYNHVGTRSAIRAFFYMLLICVREARHCLNKPEAAKACAPAIGVPANVLQHALSTFPDEASIAAVVKALRDTVGHLSLGQLTRFLVDAFNTHGKWGSSYGGPKWGNVAECLRSYVFGETTAAVMLDTVWTLSHNGGPIFNKGFLYKCQVTDTLVEVLDIQRAGQIPALVMERNQATRSGKIVTPAIAKQAEFIADVIGAPFEAAAKVDWVAVQLLGAVGHYGHYNPAAAKPAKPPKTAAPAAPVVPMIKIAPHLELKKGNRHAA